MTFGDSCSLSHERSQGVHLHPGALVAEREAQGLVLRLIETLIPYLFVKAAERVGEHATGRKFEALGPQKR